MFLKLWQVIKPGDGLIKQRAVLKPWTKVLEFHVRCPVESQHYLLVTFRVLLQYLLIMANVLGQWIMLRKTKCVKKAL